MLCVIPMINTYTQKEMRGELKHFTKKKIYKAQKMTTMKGMKGEKCLCVGFHIHLAVFLMV